LKLSNIKDTTFSNNDGSFKMEIKNHKFYFSINGDKHIFGSKLYPLGKKQSVFTYADTEQGDYDQIANMLDNSNWEHKDGHCYTNAEILHKVFLELSIDAKYYGGWVFPTAGYPVHHAWVVVDDSVYDISINVTAHRLMTKQIEEGRDPYSKECIREVKRVMSNNKPIKEHFIWGKVPEHMIYIGSEETPNSARKKYNDAMDRVSNNHPSYRKMDNQTGNKRHFKTRYQHLLDEY
jgi:hypothetical protein